MERRATRLPPDADETAALDALRDLRRMDACVEGVAELHIQVLAFLADESRHTLDEAMAMLKKLDEELWKL